MEEDVEEHEPDYVIGHSQFQQSLNQSVVIHFLQKKVQLRVDSFKSIAKDVTSQFNINKINS